MPNRAQRLCQKPGCSRLTSSRYCEEHSGHAKHASIVYDAARKSNPVRHLYFTPTWEATRRQVLTRDILCQDCRISFSVIADHIIPALIYLRHNGNDEQLFYDLSNLQGLCRACHNRKTMRETRSQPAT